MNLVDGLSDGGNGQKGGRWPMVLAAEMAMVVPPPWRGPWSWCSLPCPVAMKSHAWGSTQALLVPGHLWPGPGGAVLGEMAMAVAMAVALFMVAITSMAAALAMVAVTSVALAMVAALAAVATGKPPGGPALPAWQPSWHVRGTWLPGPRRARGVGPGWWGVDAGAGCRVQGAGAEARESWLAGRGTAPWAGVANGRCGGAGLRCPIRDSASPHGAGKRTRGEGEKGGTVATGPANGRNGRCHFCPGFFPPEKSWSLAVFLGSTP